MVPPNHSAPLGALNGGPVGRLMAPNLGHLLEGCAARIRTEKGRLSSDGVLRDGYGNGYIYIYIYV